MKYLVIHLQEKIKSVLTENCSTEIKPRHLLSPISEYVFLKKFHSLLYFHHYQYVERIVWLENSSCLVRKFLINHPTMVGKILRLLASRHQKNDLKSYINLFISQCRSSCQEAFCKKVFLQISQNLLENTFVRVSFLIMPQVLGLQLY